MQDVLRLVELGKLDGIEAFAAAVVARATPADDGTDAAALGRLRARAAEVAGLSDAECEARAAADNATRRTDWEMQDADRRLRRRRLEAMWQAWENWNPPTTDHAGLRATAIAELRGRIEATCAEVPAPVAVTGAEWQARESKALWQQIKAADDARRTQAAAVARAEAFLAAMLPKAADPG